MERKSNKKKVYKFLISKLGAGYEAFPHQCSKTELYTWFKEFADQETAALREEWDKMIAGLRTENKKNYEENIKMQRDYSDLQTRNIQLREELAEKDRLIEEMLSAILSEHRTNGSAYLEEIIDEAEKIKQKYGTNDQHEPK